MSLTNEQFKRFQELSQKDKLTADEFAEFQSYSSAGSSRPAGLPQSEQPAQPAEAALDPQAEAAGRRLAIRDVPQAIPTPRSARFSAGPGLMGGMEAAMLPEQMGTMTPAQQEQAQKVVSYMPLVAATLATPPGTVSAVALPALAELAGSMFRGETSPDTVRNVTLTAMVPGFKVKEAEGFFKRAISNTLTSGAQMGGAVFTSEALRSFFQGEGIVQSAKNAWANINPFEGDNYKVALFAPIAGSLRALGDRNSYLAKQAQKAQDELRPLYGRDVDISPGMADPAAFGRIEARLASQDASPQAIRAQEMIQEGQQAWWRGLPNAPTGPDVAARMEPYMQEVKLYQEAQQALTKLEENLANLQQAAEVATVRAARRANDPELARAADKAREELVVAQMQVVNQQARSMYFASNAEALSPSGLTPTAVQQRFTESVNEVFALRSQQAELRYKATGVPFDQPFIPVKELQQAVVRATKSDAGSYVDSLLKTIEREGGETGVLTMNQMKQLRANFGSQFNSTDPTALDQFDRIANIAYRAITRRSSAIAGRVFGGESEKALREVNSWWGETANLANKKSLKTIFNKQPDEDLAKRMASSLVNGQIRTFEDYGDFINVVSEFAPDVAQLGRRAMTDTLREGMFFLSTAQDGRLDIQKLYQNLSSASRWKGQGKVVPIESLGFGTAKQVRQVASTFSGQGIKTLTPEEMDEFYSNPLVRSALSGSGNLATVAAPAATRIAFDRRINQLLARNAVGAKTSDRDWDEAMALVKKAGMDVNEGRQRVAELQRNHPLFSFLNQPGTSVGQTLSPNGVRQVTDYLTNMPTDARGQFLRAVQETDPALLRMIQGRVIADTISGVVTATAGGGSPVALNTVAIRRAFDNSVRDESNPVHLLRQVLDPGEFTRLQQRMISFARLENWANASGGSSLLPYDLRNVTAGVIRQGGAEAGGTSIWRSILQQVYDVGNGVRYGTASIMMKDPQIAAFILTGGNTMLPIQKMILLMNDREVMEEGIVSPMLERARQAERGFESKSRTPIEQQIYQLRQPY
jgi:hypothetical protein